MMSIKNKERRIRSGVFYSRTFPILLFFLVLFPAATSKTPPPVRVDGATLPFPWLGGLNACHFAAIDLDGDGKDDYVAFDRVGSRILCFSSDWTPMPGVEDKLPPLSAWIQTHDYDGDGLRDIFTFNGISGIRVYRNVSKMTSDGYALRFRTVTDGLPAQMFGSFSPLYCTGADYPVIADLDGDGDLDVLNFWVPSTGDFLLHYRNYAMEEWQRTDTFLLKTEDWSWGCFVESEESNVIFLDSCSFRNETGKTAEKNPNAAKHAGSTLFAVKNPVNGLFDLVLGDVGYPGLSFLHNGGTPQQARITSYDTVFPLTTPARLYNFPVLSNIFWKDTLCHVLSPFETDPFNAQGSQSLWRYADTGGGAALGKLVQKDFLQDMMLDFGSGAIPVAYDYDHDGKTDLVVGNYGRQTDAYHHGGSWKTRWTASLSLLENTGSEDNPAFELKTDDYLGLSRYGLRALHPAFADLDGDGADEMVLGMEDGRLWLFRLQEDGTALLLDSAFLETAFSGFSAPVLFDLDQDGRTDLIVGAKQYSWPASPRRITKGSLTYFQNTGQRKNDRTGLMPVFRKITDSLGGVDVIDRAFSNFGYSRPSFHEDEKGEIILACGNENGRVYLYDHITGNLQGEFRRTGQAMAEGKNNNGIHASPLLHDFDGDGKPELVIGNQCGGLQYMAGTEWQAGTDVKNENGQASQTALRLFPNPVRSGFHVRIPEAGKYLFLDLQGRLLKIFDWNEGLHHVETSRLPPGTYLLRMAGNPFRINKIIKL